MPRKNHQNEAVWQPGQSVTPNTLVRGADFEAFCKTGWDENFWHDDSEISVEDECCNWILDPETVVPLSKLGYACWQGPEGEKRTGDMTPIWEHFKAWAEGDAGSTTMVVRVPTGEVKTVTASLKAAGCDIVSGGRESRDEALDQSDTADQQDDDVPAITYDDIDKALSGMLRAFEAEYDRMSRADLEARWHFQANPARSIEQELYEFLSMLTLYAGSCRRWEERHNGSTLVVERVRDTYIMPKIREFAAYLAERGALRE